MEGKIETEVAKFDPELEGEYDSDEEKKKDKKAKKVKKDKKRKDVSSPVVDIPAIRKDRPPEEPPAIKLEGLKNVKLRVLTQKILGCVVGEHVTSEAPWTTISKQVVDENLELHDDSSDFLPLKKDLKKYKDSQLLVGYDPDYIQYEDEDLHRFYVAVTEQARDTIVNQLAEERRAAEERLKNSVNKTVLPWVSYGSEKEVDDSIPTNSRPLIELELETDIDELLKPIHFVDRNIQDAKDGYVSMGPGRGEFSGVRRATVDASVQAVPFVVSGFAQTDPGLPMNAWSQYVYDMETAQEAVERSQVKALQPDHVFAEEEYLEKALEYNETFDLYTNDYPLLIMKEDDSKIPSKSFFEEYQAFTDVNHCKGKVISSIAWHPMWSGIVALSYSLAVRCLAASDTDPNLDEVTRDVFSRNSVLVWSFKDALKPRLILESPREVYSIVWSPTDPNILVGGCASGQIVIWDITSKLDAVEGHEFLTPDQQRYRLVMQNLIGWMQQPPPTQYVRPAALSALQFSHAGRVTEIQWLSPYFQLTDNGLFQKYPVNEGQSAMQILSCGEDGKVFVWDLNRVPADNPPGKPPPKKKKARKRPSALAASTSRFKVYDRKFRPIYRISPDLPPEKVTAMLTSLSMKSHPVQYELAVDPELERISEAEELAKVKSEAEQAAKEGDEQPEAKEEDEEVEIVKNDDLEGKSQRDLEEQKENKEEKMFVREETQESVEPVDSMEVIRRDSLTFREIYRLKISTPYSEPLKQFQVATDEGDTLTLQWEGFDFHRGEQITTEAATILSWGTAIHDGPIVACARSPFLDDLVLTVGGRIIALWKNELKNQPLFWKTSPVTVTSASWSRYRACMFHVGRSDGSLEVWDLITRSDFPVLVQSLSGKVLTFMTEHSLPLFGNSSILGIADYNNSLRLLFFPEEYKEQRPDELGKLKEFVEREIRLRQNYISWNENFLKSNADELLRQKALEEEAEKKRTDAEQAAEHEAQVRAKLEDDETKRLSKHRGGVTSISERYFERLRLEREKQMQRVLMEKKRLDKSELMAKQQPILMMKQMEKEKRKKQKDKIRQQQKIFDKTVAMLFPEVVEKPKEGPSLMDEFEEELMAVQPDIMQDYQDILPSHLQYVKENPFNKRLKWEKVFEEGRERRSVLDFPLYLRQKRQERYLQRKSHRVMFAEAPLLVPVIPDSGRRKTKAAIKEEEPVEEHSEAENEDEEEAYEDGAV